MLFSQILLKELLDLYFNLTDSLSTHTVPFPNDL
jgi:hypothetical protein